MGVPINLFAAGSRPGLPAFSYDGLYELYNEGLDTAGKTKWTLILKSTGKLIFNRLDQAIDVCLYGGGGGGGNGSANASGSGGGGGKTIIQKNMSVPAGQEIALTMGAGGAAQENGGNTIFRINSTTLTAQGGTGAQGLTPGEYGGGSGVRQGGADVSYEMTRSEYTVRITCTIGREGSTWYAWVSKVEVRMAYRTGTYPVNSFGYIYINNTQSVSIEGIIGTTVYGQAYSTVWKGTGTKVPISVSDNTATFTTRFEKGSYGAANQLFFYTKVGSTTLQNGITNAGNTVSSSTIGVSGTAGKTGPQAFREGSIYPWFEFGAGGGGGMLGNGPGYDGGAGGGGKGGSANADAQDATPYSASGGGGAGPNKTGGKGASGVVVIRNAR